MKYDKACKILNVQKNAQIEDIFNNYKVLEQNGHRNRKIKSAFSRIRKTRLRELQKRQRIEFEVLRIVKNKYKSKDSKIKSILWCCTYGALMRKGVEVIANDKLIELFNLKTDDSSNVRNVIELDLVEKLNILSENGRLSHKRKDIFDFVRSKANDILHFNDFEQVEDLIRNYKKVSDSLLGLIDDHLSKYRNKYTQLLIDISTDLSNLQHVDCDSRNDRIFEYIYNLKSNSSGNLLFATLMRRNLECLVDSTLLRFSEYILPNYEYTEKSQDQKDNSLEKKKYSLSNTTHLLKYVIAQPNMNVIKGVKNCTNRIIHVDSDLYCSLCDVSYNMYSVNSNLEEYYDRLVDLIKYGCSEKKAYYKKNTTKLPYPSNSSKRSRKTNNKRRFIFVEEVIIGMAIICILAMILQSFLDNLFDSLYAFFDSMF